MVQFLKKWRFTYGDRLLACLLLGAACGTAAANLLSASLASQAGFPGGLAMMTAQTSAADKQQLFLYVCRQRELEVLFGWILGLTVFSAPCFYLISAYMGTTVGLVLSVTTFQKGMMGLPCYLLTLFPQILIYLPVWLLLANWAGGKTGRLHLLPLAGLLALTFAGAVLETYFNPYFLSFL